MNSTRRWFVLGTLSGWLLAGSAFAAAEATAGATRHTYLVLQFADPLPGKQSSFDAAWPAAMQKLLAVPGVRSLELYQRAAIRLRDGVQPLPAHLALLMLSSADLPGVLQGIGRAGAMNGASSVTDPHSVRMLGYREEGLWAHPAPEGSADTYLQIVLADPMPGHAAEYDQWFRDRHGPQLVAVPGVYEVIRGMREDAAVSPPTDPPAPYSLSAMYFRAHDLQVFKAGLERAARDSITSSSAYDVEHAWRETYQRLGPVYFASPTP